MDILIKSQKQQLCSQYQFNQFQTSIMADLVKWKNKKTYEWNQDKKFLYIQIPLTSTTTLKKVQFYLSDLILRVNNLEKKQVDALDLAQQIDCSSPENKFILTNGLVHATLKKATPDQQWSNLLVEDITVADLKIRRKESQVRYEQYLKTIEQNKSKLRIEYEHKATKEMMKFEEKERNILEHKKKVQEEEAVRSVFSNVNQKTGQFQKEKQPQLSLEVQRTEQKWKEKERLALTLLEQEEARERESDFNKKKQKKQKNQNKIIEEVTKQYQKEKKTTNNSMFTDEDIQKYDEMRQNVEDGVEFEQIPIRKAAVQKVGFTERIHKNLAARDSFYKEPPMPKNKDKQLTSGQLEEKNPLWLKDKGDSFFKDKNYISAIEAYSGALRADSNLLNAVLNRSACYMKMFKLQEAIYDCDQALILLQSQLSGSQQEQIHSRLTLAKVKSRKSLCTAWKGELELARSLLNEVLELDLTQEIKSQVKQCLQQISKRQESIISKSKGDECVKLNNNESALGHYNIAIQVDENQYAVSNKILCLNKLGKYREASEQAQKGIKKMSNFNLGSSNIHTKEDKQASLILLKMYYRKSKALEEMGNIVEAEENVRRGLAVNSDDKDLQDYLKALKKKQNKQSIKKLKEESANFIKELKIKQALQNYAKCLKMLEEAQDIQEYLAILQNQCVCYQKIEKFDDVLSTCIRILKLVNRIESKVLQFGGKKETFPIEKEQLKKISVRTLVRRANAYIKTDQYYNAKSDLQKALEISPEESIKKQLQKLKSKLQS